MTERELREVFNNQMDWNKPNSVLDDIDLPFDEQVWIGSPTRQPPINKGLPNTWKKAHVEAAGGGTGIDAGADAALRILEEGWARDLENGTHAPEVMIHDIDAVCAKLQEYKQSVTPPPPLPF